MMPGRKRIFLTAEWQNLVMLNYEVKPSLLERQVPAGTELDSFEGKTYLSLVGFWFKEARLWGKISVPFHSEFEEVNLRFYVRRRVGGEERRGVCFIAEIVPKRAIAWTASLVYGENYLRFPMEHRIAGTAIGRLVEYGWGVRGDRHRLFLQTACELTHPAGGSLEQFITEHSWGYARQRHGGSVEYRVAHAPWRVAVAASSGFEGDAVKIYGAAIAEILRRKPDSAFLADGSPVEVFAGEKIV
jgi:uncharacterized protein YqjF (DUF2071 family)